MSIIPYHIGKQIFFLVYLLNEEPFVAVEELHYFFSFFLISILFMLLKGDLYVFPKCIGYEFHIFSCFSQMNQKPEYFQHWCHVERAV